MNHSLTALIVATMDTKCQETLYLAECIKKQNIAVKILDAGIKGKSPVPVDVKRKEIAKAGGKTLSEVQDTGHEGKALKIMTKGATKCARDLYRQKKIQGIIGLGGSMGTTLGTGVMRAFPIPDRKYHAHNAAITVVRTNHEEIKKLARTVAGLANNAKGLLVILVPMAGFSSFDGPDGPLPDPQAPELFAMTLKKALAAKINLKLSPYHINDLEFALTIMDTLDEFEKAK